jgi:hypothetical protein
MHQPLRKSDHPILTLDCFERFLPVLSDRFAYWRDRDLGHRKLFVVFCARQPTWFHRGYTLKLEHESGKFCAWLVYAGLKIKSESGYSALYNLFPWIFLM